MKHLSKLVFLSLFVLAGCHPHNPDTIGTATSGNTVYEEKCIDGVVYLVRHGGHTGYLTVKLTPDSTVVPCKRNTAQGERSR